MHFKKLCECWVQQFDFDVNNNNSCSTNKQFKNELKIENYWKLLNTRDAKRLSALFDVITLKYHLSKLNSIQEKHHTA